MAICQALQNTKLKLSNFNPEFFENNFMYDWGWLLNIKIYSIDPLELFWAIFNPTEPF